MQTNLLPETDLNDNPTGCCPRFDPEGWDNRRLHFDHKPFARLETRSIMHMPLKAGRSFPRVLHKIETLGGPNGHNRLIMSRDLSPWRTEHLFACDTRLPGEEMVALTGDLITRVFEGPRHELWNWCNEMAAEVRARDKQPGRIWFFHTTCPKCARIYGRNHVVGLAEL